MKKILMLVMMVVTMGLVGCGEMTAEEMEKEIVSIAEENGYEMIIIKKNDTEVESATYSVREEIEETPTPVPTEKATPTPFPTPTCTPIIEEESEVTDEVIDYKIDPNTGEKIEVLATPTPEPEETIKTKNNTTKIYAKLIVNVIPGHRSVKGQIIDDYSYGFVVTIDGRDYRTPYTSITAEEYDTLSKYSTVLVEVDADENGNFIPPMFWLQVYSYELVE